jgi:hypothetical protein
MKSLYESILDDEDVLIKELNGSIRDPFTIMKTLFNSGLKPSEINDLLQERKMIFEDWVKKNFPVFDKINLKFYLYSSRGWQDLNKCDDIRFEVYADVPNSNRKVDNKLLSIVYYGHNKKMNLILHVRESLLRFPKSSTIATRILKKINFEELTHNKENVLKKYGFKYNTDFGVEDKNTLTKIM